MPAPHPESEDLANAVAKQRLSGMPTSASGNELSRIYVQRINLINFLGRRRQFWVKLRSGDAFAESPFTRITDIDRLRRERLPLQDCAQAPSAQCGEERVAPPELRCQRHWRAFLQFDGQPALSGSGFLLLRLKCRSISLPWTSPSSPAKIPKAQPNWR
jgi:hypothetical protein